jgi:hypothetical protein
MATKKPASFDQLYPGRFLKAGTLNGQKVTLTIKDYDLKELEGEDSAKKAKTIIHFAQTPMSLVACKTNGICLREMFGTKLAEWVGKRVTLFPSTWNGKDCIRVWGSPDIAADMAVEVKLPRRKPIKMTMHRTTNGNGASAPAPSPAPASTENEGRESGDE